MPSHPKVAVPCPAGKRTFEIQALGSLGWASILTSSASGDGAEFASIMKISRRLNAPRARIYSALLDARSVAAWRVPTGMTCHLHEFDAREGGSFRISLTYDEPSGLSAADNEAGWRMALSKLAALVEAG